MVLTGTKSTKKKRDYNQRTEIAKLFSLLAAPYNPKSSNVSETNHHMHQYNIL
jgi:hypothetical protein